MSNYILDMAIAAQQAWEVREAERIEQERVKYLTWLSDTAPTILKDALINLLGIQVDEEILCFTGKSYKGGDKAYPQVCAKVNGLVFGFSEHHSIHGTYIDLYVLLMDRYGKQWRSIDCLEDLGRLIKEYGCSSFENIEI